MKGEYLNAGSHVEAFIGDLPCRIQTTRRKVAVCITSRSPRLQKLEVKMHFDHGKARVLEKKRFEYVADPTIEFSFSGNIRLNGLSAGTFLEISNIPLSV